VWRLKCSCARPDCRIDHGLAHYAPGTIPCGRRDLPPELCHRTGCLFRRKVTPLRRSTRKDQGSGKATPMAIHAPWTVPDTKQATTGQRELDHAYRAVTTISGTKLNLAPTRISTRRGRGVRRRSRNGVPECVPTRASVRANAPRPRAPKLRRSSVNRVRLLACLLYEAGYMPSRAGEFAPATMVYGRVAFRWVKAVAANKGGLTLWLRRAC
jgi:hypothetical protein